MRNQAAALLLSLAVSAHVHADAQREYARSAQVEFSNGVKLDYTHYANNDGARLCFAYAIPGNWNKIETDGMLRHEIGVARVGVRMWRASDLERYEGVRLAERAATLMTRVVEADNERRGLSAPTIEISPYESRRFRTLRWRSLPDGEAGALGRKLLSEVADGWVAEITIVKTPTSDWVAQSILETLSTTSDPDCYRDPNSLPPAREIIDKIRAASHASKAVATGASATPEPAR